MPTVREPGKKPTRVTKKLQRGGTNTRKVNLTALEVKKTPVTPPPPVKPKSTVPPPPRTPPLRT